MSSIPFERGLAAPELRAEQLFKASVSAFCALTRPSRSEAHQLEDLATPLLAFVTTPVLRYACAALASCPQAPAGLVRRLADYPVSVCAPLLVKSKVLTNVDLITLIGRHGLPHALAIARRPDLHPELENVIRALVALGGAALDIGTAAASENMPNEVKPNKAEEVRESLRGMMRPAARTASSTRFDWQSAGETYARLLSTAMTGRRQLFQTAIADVFDLDFATACEVVDQVNGLSFITALRSLDLAPEQAFTLFALLFPGGFSTAQEISDFIERYGRMDRDQARTRMLAMRAATRCEPRGSHANDRRQSEGSRVLALRS